MFDIHYKSTRTMECKVWDSLAIAMALIQNAVPSGEEVEGEASQG